MKQLIDNEMVNLTYRISLSISLLNISAVNVLAKNRDAKDK